MTYDFHEKMFLIELFVLLAGQRFEISISTEDMFLEKYSKTKRLAKETPMEKSCGFVLENCKSENTENLKLF